MPFVLADKEAPIVLKETSIELQKCFFEEDSSEDDMGFGLFDG